MSRILKFQTPEDLARVLDDYFDNTPEEKWTVTGLSLSVGSKQLLNDYEDRPDYRDIVRNARLRVENQYECDLRKKGHAGTIFALKQMGWRDRQEIEQTNYNGDNLTDEELQAKAEDLLNRARLNQ